MTFSLDSTGMSVYKGVQEVPSVVGEERMGTHQERQRTAKASNLPRMGKSRVS